MLESRTGGTVNQVLVLDKNHIEVPTAESGQCHGLAGLVHPHLYAWGSLLEIADRRYDQTGHHRGVRPDVHSAAEALRHGVDVFDDVGQDLGETTTVRRETLAGSRQPQWSLTSAVEPVNQDKTGLAFEPSEVLRDAGRRHVELTGGGADAAGGGNCPQDQQPIR